MMFVLQGTTGQPKACVLSHFGTINNGHFFGKRVGYDAKVLLFQQFLISQGFISRETEEGVIRVEYKNK